ncbi:hypothetical protein [Streptomyces collinus]|uniref:Uncharacterized protein n=1 Tax=Streptomyces collinus (strain DSM 40733 / Tue 365) TaxID=1214242 RepID=S5UVB1_STRC3|nr:hypothetical protein [Streptomyces collinus]AGS67019.1 hypothetical protein B446_00905 [Streptomyces collinus Tu 365]AGS73675.1 hypothetical protein B446_34385 [Streptomyces collinus Tu 365]
MARKVRAAQRGTWFPLLLLGVLTLGGILVDRFTFKVETVACPAGEAAAGSACTLVTQGSAVYWPLGLALAYAATACFYIRRSRNRGVGTRVRPYVLTGIVLVGLSSATAVWSLRHGMPQLGERLDFWGLQLDPTSGVTKFLERLAGNAMAVGLPLLVLAWVERSRALLLLAVVYLPIELVPLTTGWAGIPFTSPWSALPTFGVPGVLLLLGALGFGLAELSGRRNAS